MKKKKKKKKKKKQILNFKALNIYIYALVI